MHEPLNRRDFLKLMSSMPAGTFLSRFVDIPKNPLQDPAAKNVLLVVFDTFSAQHISMYGYRRETMPNLARIANKATVYHNHYAGGNWTTPGTATLLTGTYPWTHRAFSERDSVVKEKEHRNIFNVFKDYYRVGYSHNSIVDRFLHQFNDDLDLLKPQKELFTSNPLSFDRLFPWDGDTAPISWDRIATKGEKGYTYSLFFAELYEKYRQNLIKGLLNDFPRGIPHTGEDSYFLLEDAINWLEEQLRKISKPFFGYFHYLPPHRPYNTRREYVDVFKNDDMGHYMEKPRHRFFSPRTDKPQNIEYQKRQRQMYDEFILYVDAEFGRLYKFLEQSGLADNTWVVFTSDHGEMFERDIFGHKTPLLYQPVIQIPLMILEPGQQKRVDIFSATSAVDILPTLAKVSNLTIPEWTEGRVLPPYSDNNNETEKGVFALEASDSIDTQPLNPASVMMVKGKYKITYYFGYQELGDHGPLFEVFDLQNDPEELNNIFTENSKICKDLKDELLEKIKEVDAPYQK